MSVIPLHPVGGRLTPLGPELAAMRDRMARIDRTRPHVGAAPPVEDRYPVLRLLVPADAARLLCGACHGSGQALPDVRPDDLAPDADRWACRACGGVGLRCPTCCAARWVRTPIKAGGGAKIEDLVQRCPDCATPADEQTAIMTFIAACRQAVESEAAE